MFRMLRYGLVALHFALPFAIPQASQAGIIIRGRPIIVVPPYRAPVFYGQWRFPVWGFYHR